MAKRNIGRIGKIGNRTLNAMTNAAAQWTERQVIEYTPIALNFVKGQIQTLSKSLKQNVAEHKQKKIIKMDVFARGMKQGEQQKEKAMIQGMKDAGLSDTQIESVLQQVQQNNDGTGKNKKPKLKVLHIKSKSCR